MTTPSTYSMEQLQPQHLRRHPAFIRPNINLQAQDETSIQTIPELIEHNAAHNPHHLFCIQTQKRIQSARPELLSISYLQLKRAILYCQAWLLHNITELKLPVIVNGGTVSKGSPVALMVESDVGLLIHLFSLMSLGVPVSAVSESILKLGSLKNLRFCFYRQDLVPPPSTTS